MSTTIMRIIFSNLFSQNFNFNLLYREACIIIQFSDSVLRQENISMCLSDTTRQTAPPPPARHTRDHNSPDQVLLAETARGTEDQPTWLYIAQGRAGARTQAHTHN
jgi:hypothetical protein